MSVTNSKPAGAALIALLVAALFAAAFVLGRSGRDPAKAPGPAGPVLQAGPGPYDSPPVAAAPASVPLPKLARPKPTPVSTAGPAAVTPATPPAPVAPVPTSVAPAAPAVPVTPPSSGGDTIISG